MNSFKTIKGTELPFLDLKGKRYLQVMHRLIWFKEESKDGIIQTEALNVDQNFALFKATISIEGQIVSTAHGSENKQGFQDYIEKAETKAVGRALAFCGFGTQFAPELDEGERIKDSPVPQTGNKTDQNPMTKSISNSIPNSEVYTFSFGKFKGKSLNLIPRSELSSYLDWLKKSPQQSPASRNTIAAIENFLKGGA